MPHLPAPRLVGLPQLAQVFVPADHMMQVYPGALEVFAQWQRRVQIGHGAIHNAHAPKRVGSCKIGRGKGRYLQSQPAGYVKVQECCTQTISIGRGGGT
jgi:hypothetical protein